MTETTVPCTHYKLNGLQVLESQKLSMNLCSGLGHINCTKNITVSKETFVIVFKEKQRKFSDNEFVKL